MTLNEPEREVIYLKFHSLFSSSPVNIMIKKTNTKKIQLMLYE